MPKSPSRTCKKKKYNARFPPARIKKIMQTDEEVGKVAAAVPVIISRALELFIESLITETSKTTVTKNAKTLSTSHVKQTIVTNKQFDFLRDLVANVPDHQTEDNNGDVVSQDFEPYVRKSRGRSEKLALKPKEIKGGGRNRGESSKVSSHTSEEDDDEEDDEDTETDEEYYIPDASVPLPVPCTSSATHGNHGKPQDRIIHTLLPAVNYSETKGMVDSSVNLHSGMHQTSNNLVVTGAQQQPHQQQFVSSNVPLYSAPPYTPFMSSQSQGVAAYTVSPQFPNSYQPVMPSSQHQFQLLGHQNLGALHEQLDGKKFQPQQHIQQTQPQPVNFSHPSWTAPKNDNESDDYDT